MRVFHTVVFDDTVDGTTATFTAPEFNALLGLPDSLSISGYVTQASGTTPTLTVQVEQGPDERRWANRNAAAEVLNLALSLTAETTVQANDGTTVAVNRQGFARLRIQLGGTSPKARVKIWVTGRGEQTS